MPKTLEYAVTRTSGSVDEISAALNYRAEQGWRLVQVLFSGDAREREFYWEREFMVPGNEDFGNRTY